MRSLRLSKRDFFAFQFVLFLLAFPPVVYGQAFSYKDLTVENLDARIPEYEKQIDNVENDEKRGRAYAEFMLNIGSMFDKPEAQKSVIALADKTLSFKLSPEDEMNVCGRKAEAIRQQNYSVKGDSLRGPRRDMAKSLLRGYNVALKTIRDFESAHPDYDPNVPMPEYKPEPGDDKYFGLSPKQSAANDAFIKLQHEYRTIESLKRTSSVFGMVLIDIYARHPYDFDELRIMIVETLGNSSLADDLIEKTKKEISVREEIKTKRNVKFLEDTLCSIPL